MNTVAQKHTTEIQEIGELPLLASQDHVQLKRLQHECHTFTHYLVSQKPNSYVINKYCNAHSVSGMFHADKMLPLDRILLQLASMHPFGTKMADIYASMFARSSLLRRKLILLLAILETCAPSYTHFEMPESEQLFVLYLKLIQRGLLYTLFLVVSTIFLGPVHLWCAAVTQRN